MVEYWWVHGGYMGGYMVGTSSTTARNMYMCKPGS